ncbi:diguanylate cyclase (GGDEF) domain-containing protein [Ferrimonas sediminum]|uniref:diguanylate cyclase n=1 Tax=Ferrimonas sediminum TaxID=718193 RepID=A0A1G8UFK9_9GAMM|nr:diguanylate cyclase [Ferrimonas sediminum]SDJ52518.1 diguanylate cyclase (GGDEF) domain-containing protein [Ferrimonas sediminum]
MNRTPLVLLALLLLPLLLRAEPVNLRISYYEDSQSNLLVSDVVRLDPQQWVPLDGHLAHFGISRSSFWLKIAVTNQADSPKNRLLEFRSATQDQIEVFSELAGHFRMGDQQPFDNRPVQSVTPVVELEMPANSTSVVWVRLSNKHGFFELLPISLYSQEEWQRHQLERNFLYGMFFGSLGIMLLYGIALSAIIKDRNFCCYTQYLLAALVCTFIYYGFGYRWLWPTQPELNYWALHISFTALILCATRFAVTFLVLKRRARKLYRTLQILSGLLVLALIATLSGFPLGSLTLMVPLALIILALLCGCAAIATWQRPDWTTSMFFLAWPCLLVCIGLSFSNALGWMLLPFDTKYLLTFVFAFEMQLLGFLISRQFRQLKTDLVIAKANDSGKVNLDMLERNRELENLNQQLKEQAYKDSMTGLANRRSFRYELDKLEIEVSNQTRALVLIDLDHFKLINDQNGHHIGDMALKHAARVINQAVQLVHGRSYRVGGEEFAAILMAPDTQGLMAQCELIRRKLATTPMQLDNMTLNITASIGIKAIDPGQYLSSRQIYQLADKALYQAKKEGRNRICASDVSAQFEVSPTLA